MRDEKRTAPLEITDGGLAVFRGAELKGGKPINTVVRVKNGTADIDDMSFNNSDYSENTVRIAFTDGNTYTAVCMRAEDDDYIALKDFTEYWNGVEL